ncbi:MAG TPA: 6,7-dimethyl-8-ribityllumazine synthase [Candidatus Omnitrophica bacterium]|nr:MAG: 6,7-dimethyl-8-ribityllumazine synthase [Omnitrophica WOR_2 bacterium GWA2_45_18]HBR15377.1 6,7-dimethyl-8-ribityllumazine synthase [Candidatus Omnitrophota bacterium]
MAKIYEGKSVGKGVKIGVVASQFNKFITQRLVDGCLKELQGRGVVKNDIRLAWVPGAYEIPIVALKLAKKKNVDGVICLGAVVRGETMHFDLVARGAAEGIAQVSLATGKPVIFGVLTTDTVDQAYKRSEPKGDNKGRDAALAALEMINLLSQV